MEYACGGELFDHIVKRKKLKEAEACKFFQQVISGVEYIHRCGICHRDLKPENICLDQDFNLKIIDWGYATLYRPGGLTRSFRGSGCYMAPEICAGQNYDPHKIDMFSLGTILFVLRMRRYPLDYAS